MLAESGRIELAEVDRLRLEHLLEQHAVHAVLARGDADRRDRFADGGMSEHVVGARRLLDPVRIELREVADPVDGLRHIPDLIGVDHQLRVRTDHLARDPESADVLVAVRPDLELHVVVALVDSLLQQPSQLLVAVAEPSGARRVTGVSGIGEFGDARCACGHQLGQQVDRLVAG